jgi:hypothetical protein
VFIIYVLSKIKLYKKMYLLLVHCLFERFVNMYLFSMFVNNHICCALVLLFGTNCPCECGITVKCLLLDVWYFTFLQSLFFLRWNYNCLGIEPLLIYRFLQQLTRSRTVYCITRCEKLIEHTGTPVNIIYYIVALLQYEYTSKEIIISLIRS